MKFKKFLLILSFLFFLLFAFSIRLKIASPFLNPFLILMSCLSITGFYYYFSQKKIYLKNKKTFSPKVSNRFGWVYILFSLSLVILLTVEFGKGIKKHHDHIKKSDVLTQLEAQYDWWKKGEFPYQRVVMPNHSPYPVYMPLNWMPMGISKALNIDIRWSGYILFLLSCLLVSSLIFYEKKSFFCSFIALFLLLLPLYFYSKFGSIEIFVSYETLIATYYIILGVGLWKRNFWLIAIGILCCLLSRYTLFFWLPLFAILYFVNEGWKKSFQLWGFVFLGVLFIYVIPFLSKDPTILTRGLTYHNNAAVAEWVGFKNTGISYTMKKGIYFANWMKYYFSGDMAQKIYYARVIQASLMIFLFFGGVLFYFFKRNQINFYDYSLMILFLTIMTFYLFGPLTYHYYLLVPLMLAAVMSIQVISKLK